MKDGLCLIENDAHILAMMESLKDEDYIFLMVDHKGYIKGLRPDVIVPIPSKYTTNPEPLEAEKDGDNADPSSPAISIDVVDHHSSKSKGKEIVQEFPILSMLETIFYKTMHRNVGKQKECEKWTGLICAKIKKKLDKAT